ncbi:MAG: methyltransferase domain-containing protein [Chloroflexi bacterium]|nr:methyltransferase domain-containing protein [Chloroflexota bacterium]
MRESAAPGDTRYLLRDLDHTPYRFRLNSENHTSIGSVEADIIAFIREHPGSTVKQIAEHVLPDWAYNDSRALVVRLVDKGILELAGLAPLESVDLRYERVSACDLCGAPSSGHPIILWKYNTPVVRCTGCGLLYANPRWKAEHLFGRYTDEYWQQYSDKISQIVGDLAANLARYDPYLNVLEAVRQSGRLLDVGCATGGFLLADKNRGWEVYGVETSPISAAQAKEVSGGQIHAGTLETAPYPDGWFDGVTLMDVIEHLQSPRAYVERIARLVRPGGIFCLSTPNIRSLGYKVLGRNWTEVGPNDHLYYFTPRTLTRLLEACGFTIHSMQSMGVQIHTWQRWLRYPALYRLAPLLYRTTLPITNRLLMGDSLYVVARRNSCER